VLLGSLIDIVESAIGIVLSNFALGCIIGFVFVFGFRVGIICGFTVILRCGHVAQETVTIVIVITFVVVTVFTFILIIVTRNVINVRITLAVIIGGVIEAPLPGRSLSSASGIFDGYIWLPLKRKGTSRN